MYSGRDQVFVPTSRAMVSDPKSGSHKDIPKGDWPSGITIEYNYQNFLEIVEKREIDIEIAEYSICREKMNRNVP